MSTGHSKLPWKAVVGTHTDVINLAGSNQRKVVFGGNNYEAGIGIIKSLLAKTKG